VAGIPPFWRDSVTARGWNVVSYSWRALFINVKHNEENPDRQDKRQKGKDKRQKKKKFKNFGKL
jgi:hypothetical protein